MQILSLPYSSSFNFSECLDYLPSPQRECLWQKSETTVTRLIRCDDKFFLTELSLNKNDLQVKILNRKAGKLQQEFIKKFYSEWFDLDYDLKTFYAFAGKVKLLKPLIGRYMGLHLAGIPDLFEALAWAILGQQINMNFAYTMKRNFVNAFGDHLIYNDKVHHHFPSFDVVARLKIEDLLPLQFSRQKAAYITGVAQVFADHTISKKQLLGLDYEEAKQNLLQLKGIGNWTADYVLMKCLHHRNALPAGDAGLHNAIKKQLQLSRKPTIEEIKTLSKNWGHHAAYATFYLWRSLKDKI